MSIENNLKILFIEKPGLNPSLWRVNMKAYRIYDNEQQRFIKIGKRSNDLYVKLELVEHSLKTQFKVDDIKPRFDIIEYDLVRTRKI